MEPTLTPTEAGLVVRLPAALTFNRAEALARVLREAVDGGGPVVIEAALPERMSTACIQVLLSAARTMQERDIAFVVREPSDPFVAAFSDLGLFGVLMTWNME